MEIDCLGWRKKLTNLKLVSLGKGDWVGVGTHHHRCNEKGGGAVVSGLPVSPVKGLNEQCEGGRFEECIGEFVINILHAKTMICASIPFYVAGHVDRCCMGSARQEKSH